MQYVSIYRLAEICDVDPEKLDILSIRDLQNKLKKLYDQDDIEIYQLGDDPVTVKEANEWLWKSSSSDNLNFCKWVHRIPSLEYYLETRQIDLELNPEIPADIQKSFNFLRFGNFLEPFIEDKLVEDIKFYLAQRKFELLNVLLHFSTLLSKTAQYSLEPHLEASLNELQGFFENQINLPNPVAPNFFFLQTPGFKKFLDVMEKSKKVKKDLLLNTISKALAGLNNPVDAELREKISVNLGLTIPTARANPIAPVVPDEVFATPDIKIVQNPVTNRAEPKKVHVHPTAQPTRVVQPKKPVKAAQSSSKPRISTIQIMAIVFGVFVLIARIAMNSSSKDYDYDYPDINMPDYGGMLEDSDMSLDLDWEGQLASIRDYAEFNESLDQKPVAQYKDWYDEVSEEELTEPFIDFFYPLYNKDGEDEISIINESNYAVIILVKGEEDCYSYIIESKTSYDEIFDLNAGEEIVFYFGKEYQVTNDLSTDDVKGFRYVDENTLTYLDSIYVVGSGSFNSDSNENYQIKITERGGKPRVSFEYHRNIKATEWWNL